MAFNFHLAKSGIFPLKTAKALDPALKAAWLLQQVATPSSLKVQESSEACHSSLKGPSREAKIHVIIPLLNQCRKQKPH